MSFLETRFPESISFNSSSILEFKTSVISTKNGSEQRNINWRSNRMKFNIVNGIKTKAELDEIISFFRNVRGRAYGFRFKDWTDYKAEKQPIATGDGETKSFQLIKTYIIDNNIYVRKITKPVISTVKVCINGAVVDDVELDLKTGIITFNEAPALDDEIEADFEFDVPVRFDSDVLEITMDTVNTGKVKDVVLVEI